MKIKVADLCAALHILDAVPVKTTIASSMFIKMEPRGKRLTMQVASDISAEAFVNTDGDWPLEGLFFVDRKLFVSFCNNCKALPTITFRSKASELIVSAKGRSGRFTNMEGVPGYITFGRTKGTEVVFTQEDIEILQLAATTAGKSDIDPHLCAIVLDSGRAMATDTETLFHAPISYDGPTLGIPLELIDHLALATGIYVTDSAIRVKFPRGLIEQQLSSEVQSRFPIDAIVKYYEMLLGFDQQLSCDADILAMHVSQLSGYGSNVTDAYLQIRTAKVRKEVVLVMNFQPKHGTTFTVSMVPGGTPTKSGFDALVRLGRLQPILTRLAALAGDEPVIMRGTNTSPGIVFSRGDVFVSIARANTLDDDTSVEEE